MVGATLHLTGHNLLWHARAGCGKSILCSLTSAAKAGIENKPVIAALKPLRHPKSSAEASFSAAREGVP